MHRGYPVISPQRKDLTMNQPAYWDCHMHSEFSSDSPTPMEEMIRASIDRHLSGICFTEHLDPDFPTTPDGLDFSLDIPAYRQKLEKLQEIYRDKISIRFGIELGLQPHLGEYFRSLISSNSFDFVIGSSHLIHGCDPYYPEYFQHCSEAEGYREYFSSILENLSAFDGMDVYGHIDYIVRYGPNKNRDYSYEKYQDILDEILLTLIRKHVGIEVNTGGLHYGLGEPNPCTDVIRRYRELGGEIITIGSDAHRPDRMAQGIADGMELLRSVGFRYFTIFSERKPEFIKL